MGFMTYEWVFMVPSIIPTSYSVLSIHFGVYFRYRYFALWIFTSVCSFLITLWTCPDILFVLKARVVVCVVPRFLLISLPEFLIEETGPNSQRMYLCSVLTPFLFEPEPSRPDFAKCSDSSNSNVHCPPEMHFQNDLASRHKVAIVVTLLVHKPMRFHIVNIILLQN